MFLPTAANAACGPFNVPNANTSPATSPMASGGTITVTVGDPCGDRYTICDPYLLVVYRCGLKLKMPIKDLPNFVRFNKQMLARPAVQRVYAREGMSWSDRTRIRVNPDSSRSSPCRISTSV